MRFIWAPLLVGCAGPSSPFGGLELGSGDGLFSQYSGQLDLNSAQLKPERQVLHESSDLSLEIKTTQSNTADVDLRVVYNDRDVTYAFKKFKSEEQINEGVAKYSYSDLRLLPSRKHEIEFYFRKNKNANFTKVDYLAPSCKMKASDKISNTGTFSPSPDVMALIHSKAKKYNVNPAFLLGLITQESGFDEAAVSSSRALGLTQVTPLAAIEVQKMRTSWKRHKKFDNASPSEIKKMVSSKKVTGADDWRLDPDRSIEGGLLYLKYLEEYWAQKDNAEILKLRPEIKYGTVILASYNSGAARVKRQILDADEKWLEQPKLKEAFRYVSSIQSYCYHFSKDQL
ncbi:MAG: transglycosylase SLT domain-containing protein [Bdellovibrionales bacterium]|nr:transglycosylase SLT domain-containing protein [Bdellovibrionales bacterium]